MPDFNPSPKEKVQIAGHSYEVMPHPAVPTFAFGQEGRKAYVFQLKGGPNGGDLYALKKFKEVFRLPVLVDVNEDLAQFSAWDGLEVCERNCLQKGEADDVLTKHPDLEFAVLMPWITGTTWYDVVIAEKPLTKADSLSYANAMAQVLAGLEEAGLAHCDISAANVIINPVTERAHLIDVEDIFAPGFTPPTALPAGTDGYAHKTASSGLWGSDADRFAGAIILCEMATWYHPEIRKKAEEEHFFAQDEMQTPDVPRYHLMKEKLNELDPRLADLFDQAWHSNTLADCPRLNIWQDILEDLYRQTKIAEIVGGWRPLTLPGQEPPEPVMDPLGAPAEPEKADETEAEPAPAPAPQPAPPAPDPIPAASITQTAPPPKTSPSRPPKVSNGGISPVVEWQPLAIPEPMGTERKPLTMPEPDPMPEPEPIAPAPVIEDELEESPVIESVPLMPAVEDEEIEPFPDPVVEAEPEPLIEEADPDATIVNPNLEMEEDPEPEPEPIDEEEIFEDSVPDPVEDEESDEPSEMLFKPHLDLSHIDKRSRPFLVWTASPDAVEYLVQEARDPDFTSGVKEFDVKGADTHWNPAWGRTGRMYYRVCALGEESVGPWSEVLALRFAG